MQPPEILSELTDVFREVLDNDSIELALNTTAADIPGWDSFQHINLIVATEAEFGVKFKTAEMESLQNVGHFVDLIQAKLAKIGR